jgi:uncharacterized protein YjbJ (UPF0337 family)
MSTPEGVKNKVVGKTKRLVGELLGDQSLHDEGKEQDRQGDADVEDAGGVKPLRNLNKLT